MSPPDDPPNGVILFRVETLEASIKEMRSEMRGGFAGLQFVSREVYAAEKRSVDEYAAETRRIAEDARKVAWANAVLLLTITTVLLAVIKAVAS
jgi:hypothetical protein